MVLKCSSITAGTLNAAGDCYRQSQSFMRYDNADFDRIRSWDNINASLLFANADLYMNVQLFVKNLADKDTIVGFDIADGNLGATRSIFLLEPRLYGISVTNGF